MKFIIGSCVPIFLVAICSVSLSVAHNCYVPTIFDTKDCAIDHSIYDDCANWTSLQQLNGETTQDWWDRCEVDCESGDFQDAPIKFPRDTEIAESGKTNEQSELCFLSGNCVFLNDLGFLSCERGTEIPNNAPRIMVDLSEPSCTNNPDPEL